AVRGVAKTAPGPAEGIGFHASDSATTVRAGASTARRRARVRRLREGGPAGSIPIRSRADVYSGEGQGDPRPGTASRVKAEVDMRSIIQSLSVVPFVVGAALAGAHLPAAAADSSGFNPHGFKLPTGVYRCDLNRSVNVRSVSADMQSAVVQFDKKE